MSDRFGIGWRPELAAGIVANLHRLDVIEVLAEEWKPELQLIASQLPITIHSTSLGIASAAPVDERRLARVARVVREARPESWSEHLAFVRGGGVEIGHLAAPPRTRATLEGLKRNLARCRDATGMLPMIENVATLIDPPLSDMSEKEWMAALLAETDAMLLLDLHNLYANALNFGFSATDVLRAIPSHRIGAIHLAGGRFLEGGRLLDDHLHAVPDAVFDLLAFVFASRTSPLTVILERDGCYPSFDVLLREVERAREVSLCPTV